MEWCVGESNSKMSAKLTESEGALSLSGLTSDGVETSYSDVSIRRDEHPGRLVVEVNGAVQFAHVAKVGDSWWIHLNGRIHVVHGHEPGSADSDAGEGGLTAPMPGTILEVLVKEGQRVREGQALLVMEAMKMEHRIQAPRAGEVVSVNFVTGDRVDMGDTLVELGE